MRLAVCGFTALVLLALPAQAEMSGGKIKIGVLTDMSGSYWRIPAWARSRRHGRDEEFGSKINGKPIETGYRRSPEQARYRGSIARRWFDLDGVDAVTDLVNSAVGFRCWRSPRPTKGAAAYQRRFGGLYRQGVRAEPSVHWIYDS